MPAPQWDVVVAVPWLDTMRRGGVVGGWILIASALGTRDDESVAVFMAARFCRKGYRNDAHDILLPST